MQHRMILNLCLIMLVSLFVGCSQVAEPTTSAESGGEPDAEGLTALAPGVRYLEHDTGVMIDLDFMAIDDTSVDAMQTMTTQTGSLSAQSADDTALQARSEAWSENLVAAQEAMTLINSQEGQAALKSLEDEDLGVQQAVGCSLSATARSTSPTSGAKGDARVNCSSFGRYRAIAEAKASANGRLDKDDDESSKLAIASAVAYGTSSCSSSALAQFTIKTTGPDLPGRRRSDTSNGC